MLSIDKAQGSFMQVSKVQMIRQLRGEERLAISEQRSVNRDQWTEIREERSDKSDRRSPNKRTTYYLQLITYYLLLTTYYLLLTKKGSLPTNDPLMKEKHRYITRGNSTFVQAPFPTLLLPVEVWYFVLWRRMKIQSNKIYCSLNKQGRLWNFLS